MSEFQTYLKDCDCKGGGVLHYKGKIHCRWCRKPYAKAGMIRYEDEHFEKEMDIPKDWEGFWLEGNVLTSVKRLCDGEVFTVDGKFLTDYSYELTVNNFQIVDNKILVWSKERGYWPLNSIKPLPKPKERLYTTEEVIAIIKNQAKLMELCLLGK